MQGRGMLGRGMLVALLLTGAAHAAGSKPVDFTVYGLRLGESFSVPECKIVRERRIGARGVLLNRDGNDIDAYEKYPATDYCFKRDLSGFLQKSRVVQPLPQATDGSFALEYAQAELPVLMFRGFESEAFSSFVYLVDGRLEGVTFRTRGLANQDEVLAALTGKYGKPTSVEPIRLQNDFGATFNTLSAKWRLPGLQVTFNSVTKWTSGSSNIGTVIVETDKAVAHKKQQALPDTHEKHSL